jgi:hypothetical protein
VADQTNDGKHILTVVRRDETSPRRLTRSMQSRRGDVSIVRLNGDKLMGELTDTVGTRHISWKPPLCAV